MRRPVQRKFGFVDKEKKRPKLGRPVGPNPRIRHETRDDFAASLPCHVTLPVRRDDSLAALGTGRARGRELVPEGVRPGDVPARPLLDPGRSRPSARGGGRGEGAGTRDEVDRRALRARREPGAEAERAGAPRPLPLQRAQDADPGAERAALRAAERSAPLGEEPAAAREGRGQDHARLRAARARRPVVRAVVRRLEGRRRARPLASQPGGEGEDLAARASAGGAAAGSSTRTRSRAACAPDRPARRPPAPPLRLRRGTEARRRPEPGAPAPAPSDSYPSQAFRLRLRKPSRAATARSPPCARSSSAPRGGRARARPPPSRCAFPPRVGSSSPRAAGAGRRAPRRRSRGRTGSSPCAGSRAGGCRCRRASRRRSRSCRGTWGGAGGR